MERNEVSKKYWYLQMNPKQHVKLKPRGMISIKKAIWRTLHGTKEIGCCQARTDLLSLIAQHLIQKHKDRNACRHCGRLYHSLQLTARFMQYGKHFNK